MSRRKLDRTKETGLNACGQKMTIIEYFSNSNITILFEDNTIVKNKSYISFKNGTVFKNNTPSYYGIGFQGGEVLKSQLKILRIWNSMFARCYNNKKLISSPTYKDCSVDPRWHNFQNFAKWFEENYVEGWQLDKDILVPGNKVYGPDTCCFVPQEINLQFRTDYKKLNELPRGVNRSLKNYTSSISFNKKLIYLGIFKTKEEASEAYETKRSEKIDFLVEKYRELLDKKVYKILKKNNNGHTK